MPKSKLYLLEDVLLETDLNMPCDEEQCNNIAETPTIEIVVN